MASTIANLIKNLLAYTEQVSKEGRRDDIRRLIDATEECQIVQAIDFTASRTSHQLLSLLKVVSAGLSGGASSNSITRKKLVQTIIGLLRSSRLDGHLPSSVLCVAFAEIDLLNAEEIVELLQFYKGVFEKGIEDNVSQKFIDVFPKLLHALSLKDASDNGASARRRFMQEFCRFPGEDAPDEDVGGNKWHPSSIGQILSALKEAPLTTEEKAWVVSKTIRSLPELDLDDVPDVVYTLLGFIADGPKGAAIHGICDFFSDCDRRGNQGENLSDSASSPKERECLKRNQGLVILHLMHAARQNQDICGQLTRTLKGKHHDLLSPFNFGVLLALSQVGPRMKDQTLELGRTTVLQYLKDRERRANSVWVNSVLTYEEDLDDLAKEIAANSDVGFGWQHSLNGLYELGFTLIETHLPKIIVLGTGKLTVESPNSALYNACVLGKNMICKCFAAFTVLQREMVFDRLFQLITCASPNGRGSTMFFIDVLTGLVGRGATAILSNEERVTDIFDALPTLTSDVAVPMLKSLLPIIKLSPSLRDALVLALKKTLFSRSPQGRKTAVGGLLLFLKHFKIMNAFKSAQSDTGQSMYWHSFPTFGSQLLSDPNSDPQRSNYERLCLEVIGCLRRTLSQQGEVKETLYYGLCSVIRRNVSTLQPVVDFLYRHLSSYLEKDEDVMPPFKLKNCVDTSGEGTVTTTEELGWLIYALNQCLKQAEDDKRRIVDEDVINSDEGNASQFYFNDSSIQQVKSVLSNLARRVSNAELEDFGLDKSADYSASAVGEANVKMGKVLLSTYEALIGFTWSFYDYEPDTAETILCLHNNYCKLQCLLQERVEVKGRKAAKAAAGFAWKLTKDSEASTEIISLNLWCLSDMAKQLLCDQTPRQRAGLSPLRGNEEFIRWLFQTILAKVNGLYSRRKSDTSKSFEVICGISSLMLQYYTSGENIIPEMKRAILKPLELVALEIVAAVMDVVTRHFSDKFEDALNIWGAVMDPQSQVHSQGREMKLAYYAKPFQHRLKQLLISRGQPAARGEDRMDEGDVDLDADEKPTKHISMLLRIIETIWKQLPLMSEETKKAYSYLLQLCEEQTVKEAVIGRQLWQLLLRMHRQICTTADLPRKLAHNVRSIFGDVAEVEGDVAAGPEAKLSSVTQRTAPSVATVLLTHLDEWRDDCLFLIEHAKRNLALAKDKRAAKWMFNEEQEDSVCERLNMLADVWMELAKSELPNAQIQSAMKLLQAYFTTCTNLVRYYLLLHQAKLGHITAKFVDLVRFAGNKLIPVVYKFIGYAKCQSGVGVGPTAKKTSTVVAKQALREMKDVSSLIFTIETFEKVLVELSGKCKDKTLVDRMYIGHSRDFRIDYEKFCRSHTEQRQRNNETEDDAPDDSAGTSSITQESGNLSVVSNKRTKKESGKRTGKRKKTEAKHPDNKLVFSKHSMNAGDDHVPSHSSFL